MNVYGFIPAVKIFAVLVLLPSFVALGLGVHFYRSTKGFVGRAVACQGRVVELKATRNENGSTYYPVFAYSDASGTQRQGQSNVSSNLPGYSLGDAISLLYDPANPSDVRVNSFWPLWFAPAICAIAGLPFLFTSLIIYFLVPFTIRRVWPDPARGGPIASGAPPPLRR
ncbi:MAG TPA: DUF3592 domain-containing protein [Tepidisphaeraceae bacterium]|jgi:hypothetical protein|nr:DUF3592 domain-containing protein [Tepidisphaeraceae bacterium]